MGISVLEQLRSMIAALIAGGTAGLLTDLLRPPRDKNRIVDFLLDLLALILSGCWLFVVGQRVGAGMSLFFLCVSAAGAVLYVLTLHGMVAHDILYVKQFFLLFIRKLPIVRLTKRKNAKITENDKNVS